MAKLGIDYGTDFGDGQQYYSTFKNTRVPQWINHHDLGMQL